MTLATPRDILDFWFVEIPRERWFSASPEFDQEIRTRFEETWEAARNRALSHWLNTKDGALAFILLTDQFPRNMFRGEGRAFATDPLALEAARVAITRGYDRNASTDERNFLYLPFMHSENLDDQEFCVALCRERLGEENSAYAFALRHRDAIARFSRFPARNAALKRATTKEESEFLATHPSGF